MNLLERAIEIALKAHAGQIGKDRGPYIVHPLRMMGRMETEEERIVAVLHDVVEDSEVTLDDLRLEGFSEEAVEAVRLLTHEEGTPDEEYVRRIKPNALARKVKLADLEDNSDLRRLTPLGEKAAEKLKKYQAAWAILAGA